MERVILLLGFLEATVGLVYGNVHFLFAPQVIREGVDETVALSLHNVTRLFRPIKVTATVLCFQTVTNVVYPNVDPSKPIELTIRCDKPDNTAETTTTQYASLSVKVTERLFSNFDIPIHQATLRMRVLENSGYLYVQTDRPIYRPQEIVKFRIAALTNGYAPERGRKVNVVIRIPNEDVGVRERNYTMNNMKKFIEDTFSLPEFPVYGLWSVEARYAEQKVVKWSKRYFDVRPYVLPTFNVRVETDRPFILVKREMVADEISGIITAAYSYGKKIYGNYYISAKLVRPSSKVTFFQYPDEGKQARIYDGKATFKIKTTEVLNALLGETGGGFQLLQDEGATVVIDVSVTDSADGTIQSARSRALGFATSPFIIKIERMSKYYTPGVSFEIKADVVDLITQRPMKRVTITLTGPFSCGRTACAEGECCVGNACGNCRGVLLESDENGQINYNVNTDGDLVPRSYNLRTRKLGVDDENQASLTFELQPYESTDGGVLLLSATRKIASVNEKAFQIEMKYISTPPEFRYMISARGSIVATGSDKPEARSRHHTMTIAITSKMVPSFRIFVYYFHKNKMVSNSLWVDVLDACAQEIKVSVPERVLPGDRVEVKYEGSPNALIGVSAVDRAAYFLYGDSRLTRHEVFEGLNEYDQGCSREGGRDAQHVFEEGGFQVVTDGSPYPAKYDFRNYCKYSSRTKRAAGDGENGVKAVLLDENWRSDDCYTDSLISINTDESCLARAEIVKAKHGIDCAEAFLKGCEKQEYSRIFARSASRSIAAAAAHKKSIAGTRPDFKESMMWKTVLLDSDGKLTLDERATDSITTFEFNTVSMHPEDGFCVAPTQNMTIFKKVFVQLRVPYSLKRREQAEIKATVFNYESDIKEIRLYIKMSEDICSHYPADEFSKIANLRIRPNSVVGVNFMVLPLRIPRSKEVTIEAKAINRADEVMDHIKRSILVEPEGDIREIQETKTFDLRKKQSEKFQLVFTFPENFVPETRQCWLYPYSNFMGPVIEFDPVTKQPKNDVTKIIKLPHGCGEQNMAKVGPNVYAHKYLLSVGKMLPGSAEETGSIEKLEIGFANVLKHRCDCQPKVWSVYSHVTTPSAWLNAYNNKVFAEAKQFHTTMDMKPICTSVKWLTTLQTADGSFDAGGRVGSRYMHGAVGTRLTLTAYVMMSLVESLSLCDLETMKDAEQAVMSASQYLENHKTDKQMDQPYAAALAAYAMTVYDVNHRYSVELRARLKSMIKYVENGRLAFLKGASLTQIQGTGTHAYWYKVKPLAVDIEATAYGLLALLLEAQDTADLTQGMFDLIRKVVLWLIEQRDENGGFTTTQDTVVGLHALSEYMIWSNTAEPDIKEANIDVTIDSPSGTEYFNNPLRFHLDKTNENVTTPIEVRPNAVAKGILNVQAEGEGEGTISYRCVYRTLVDEESCHFDLAVSVTEHQEQQLTRSDDPPIKIKMQIRVSKLTGDTVGQSIVHITLISGYEPDDESLKRLTQDEYLDGIIERYEVANQTVILYLEEVTATPINIAFFLKREVNIKNPNPATVSVYYYYEPSVRCTKFYALPNNVPQLRTTPCNDESGSGGEDMCKCAEGGCLKCRTRKDHLERTMCMPGMSGKCRICQGRQSDCFNMTRMACKSAYVYRVNMTKTVKDTTGVFVSFEGRIVSFIKRGPDTYIKKNDVRKFTTRTDCFHGCRDDALEPVEKDGTNNGELFLQEEGSFLVFGNEYERRVDRSGHDRSQYLLKEGDHVERAYSPEKCNKAKKLIRGMCKKRNRTKAQKAKCKKNKSIDQSCTNLKRLIEMVERGCDSL